MTRTVCYNETKITVFVLQLCEVYKSTTATMVGHAAAYWQYD